MNRSIFFLLLLSSLVWVTGCAEAPKESATDKTASISNSEMLAQGFNLLESNCFSCHSPDASIDNRIAPPMYAVKRHYVDENTTKEAFTADLINFMLDPSAEKSKMPGALERFGLMPKMIFSKDQLTSIAHYIYETELEKPDWFEAHYQSERKKHAGQLTEEKLTDVEQGLKYAMATKGVLGKNLLGAINTKGTAGALEFCNVQALPLTDSMSVHQNVKIKRVSDKNRNPNNAANAEELAYIASAKETLANGEKIKPLVNELQGRKIGYYPITTNNMCLQCHGTPGKELKEETLAAINKLYPEDKAIGYGPNQLRGIWVIEF